MEVTVNLGVVGKYAGNPAAESQPAMANRRAICLCWQCALLRLGKDGASDPDNCPIATALYGLCVEHDIVTPVVRCPKFQAA